MPYKNHSDLLAYRRKWRAANKEKCLASGREGSRKWRAKNPDYRLVDIERYRGYVRAWTARNKDRVAEMSHRHYVANKALYFAKYAARRAAKLNATPPWVDHAALVAIYEKSRALKLEVDHIIPLKHRLVCGLHVPWNLQLLPMIANRQKHNSFQVG